MERLNIRTYETQGGDPVVVIEGEETGLYIRFSKAESVMASIEMARLIETALRTRSYTALSLRYGEASWSEEENDAYVAEHIASNEIEAASRVVHQKSTDHCVWFKKVKT